MRSAKAGVLVLGILQPGHRSTPAGAEAGPPPHASHSGAPAPPAATRSSGSRGLGPDPPLLRWSQTGSSAAAATPSPSRSDRRSYRSAMPRIELSRVPAPTATKLLGMHPSSVPAGRFMGLARASPERRGGGGGSAWGAARWGPAWWGACKTKGCETKGCEAEGRMDRRQAPRAAHWRGKRTPGPVPASTPTCDKGQGGHSHDGAGNVDEDVWKHGRDPEQDDVQRELTPARRHLAGKGPQPLGPSPGRQRPADEVGQLVARPSTHGADRCSQGMGRERASMARVLRPPASPDTPARCGDPGRTGLHASPSARCSEAGPCQTPDPQPHPLTRHQSPADPVAVERPCQHAESQSPWDRQGLHEDVEQGEGRQRRARRGDRVGQQRVPLRQQHWQRARRELPQQLHHVAL